MRVSKKFDVAGWIVPVLIERRGVVYLDTTWISAVTGTALFSRRRATSAARGRRGAALPVGAGQRRLMSCPRDPAMVWAAP